MGIKKKFPFANYPFINVRLDGKSLVFENLVSHCLREKAINIQAANIVKWQVWMNGFLLK
jgi:hypothetical protein